MENYNAKMMGMFGQGASIFGMALIELAKTRDDIIVLAADQSTPAGLDKFKATYPDRFMNVGIAEQNMIGIAAGLSDEGYLPVCVAQACFLSMRAFEPIRQYAGYMHKPMILVGVFSGFSTTLMGNTHYALEDMALMRSIPGMTVCAPADAMEAAKCFEEAVEKREPMYMRLWGGTGLPIVNQENYSFEIGKSIHMREGKDVQLIATGSMVYQTMQAASLLSEVGIEAEVINMHTVKPLDCSRLASDMPIFTIEEHNIIGGLGDAVIGVGFAAKKIAVNDRFGSVGDYTYLLQENGLTAEQIKETIIKTIQK